MKLSRLKLHVDRSGYTIRNFCQLVGIKTPTYYKAINSNDIKASVLEKICILLNISPLEFFETNHYEEGGVMFMKVADINARYQKKEEIHIGKIIESRLDEIGMNVAEFGRRIGTTRQNAKGILERKNITIDNAIIYNSVLNPPGSKPWDLFENFLRTKPQTIEDKYIQLLEEHNRLKKKNRK